MYFVQMMIQKRFIFLIIGLCLSLPLASQASTLSKDSSSLDFVVLPLIYFSPETSWAFGVGTASSFRFKNESSNSRLSQIQVGGAYTLNKQLLTYLSYKLFLKEDEYNIYGEIGYYKYVYDFYGVGNEQPIDFREVYELNYPRFRLNVLKKIIPNLYGGIRYWYDDFQNLKLDPQGQLAQGNIAGYQGGKVSQLGLVLNYDSRNNVIYPTKGALIEGVWAKNSKSLGSDFDFERVRLNAAAYFEINPNQILAVNLYGDFVNGNPPFNEMALLGGPKQLRGYYEGRYRDKNVAILQAEYRMAIFQNIDKTGWKWLKRFKIAVFGGYGSVASSIKTFETNNFRYAYGGGVRFALTESGINLRVDYGVGQNTTGIYVTIGEAF